MGGNISLKNITRTRETTITVRISLSAKHHTQTEARTSDLHSSFSPEAVRRSCDFSFARSSSFEASTAARCFNRKRIDSNRFQIHDAIHPACSRSSHPSPQEGCHGVDITKCCIHDEVHQRCCPSSYPSPQGAFHHPRIFLDALDDRHACLHIDIYSVCSIVRYPWHLELGHVQLRRFFP